MPPLNPQRALPLIRQALREDLGAGDLTSRTVIPPDLRIRARIVAKARGIVAGVDMAALTFSMVDHAVRCRIHRHSGDPVAPGAVIMTVEGRARATFAAERTALNFLGHLSGIATLTDQFVQQVKGTRAKILDTRKTIPGLRLLQKYAVAAGGGHNHRLGLHDAVLIKTTHLRALRGSGIGDRDALIRRIIQRAQQTNPRRFIEIEVTSLAEFRAALRVRPHAILLDNWSLAAIKTAVQLRNESRSTIHDSPLLEVSGGVTLENVRAIARTGVERISIGRLTHSAPALDVSLQVLA